MSESKRVHFETIGAVKKSSTTEKSSDSIVLELKLFEPTDVKFPQFDYDELIRIEKVIKTVFFFFSFF